MSKQCRISTFSQNAKVKGKRNNKIRGVLVRLSNNSLLKCPVNKLYLIEYVQSNSQEPADTENLKGSRQEAVEIGELRQRFAE